MSSPAASEIPITVEDYLAGELISDVKHEYLGGAVYGMAGASEAHNYIAGNLLAGLIQRLRGNPCHAFGSDMKLRLNPLGETYFYYPDVMIACDPADAGRDWRERPTALFEIISEQTRRIDEREKRLAYRQIPSLQAYIRFEQIRAEAVVELRSEHGWSVQSVSGRASVVRIPSLDLELPLTEIYERVAFKSRETGVS